MAGPIRVAGGPSPRVLGPYALLGRTAGATDSSCGEARTSYRPAASTAATVPAMTITDPEAASESSSLDAATRDVLIKPIGRAIDLLGVDTAQVLAPILVGYLAGCRTKGGTLGHCCVGRSGDGRKRLTCRVDQIARASSVNATVTRSRVVASPPGTRQLDGHRQGYIQTPVGPAGDSLPADVSACLGGVQHLAHAHGTTRHDRWPGR